MEECSTRPTPQMLIGHFIDSIPKTKALYLPIMKSTLIKKECRKKNKKKKEETKLSITLSRL